MTIQSRDYYEKLYHDIILTREVEINLPEKKKTMKTSTFINIEREIVRINKFMGYRRTA